jgi:hypothetical protein
VIVVARPLRKRDAIAIRDELNWATNRDPACQFRYKAERGWIGWAVVKDLR